jgi:Transcription factor IIA, alpha/beta subunit
MSNGQVGTVYQQIIQDVVESSRVDFEEGGVDEHVLEELKLVGSPFSLSLASVTQFWSMPFHLFLQAAASHLSDISSSGIFDFFARAKGGWGMAVVVRCVRCVALRCLLRCQARWAQHTSSFSRVGEGCVFGCPFIPPQVASAIPVHPLAGFGTG